MPAKTAQQKPHIVLTSPPTAVLQSYDSIILMSQQRSDFPCGLQSLTLSLGLPQLSTAAAAAAARAVCAEKEFRGRILSLSKSPQKLTDCWTQTDICFQHLSKWGVKTKPPQLCSFALQWSCSSAVLFPAPAIYFFIYSFLYFPV